MTAKVISFINMKGGVGKTTLTIGLAVCLSNHGNRVLVIDADPQFNATQSLLDDYRADETSHIQKDQVKILDQEDPSHKHNIDDVDDSEFNYYQKVVLAHREKEQQATIYRLFTAPRQMGLPQKLPGKEIITPLKKNLSLLCGDLYLVLANSSIDYRFASRLKTFIQTNNLKNDYDFILIDCPPTLTIYTDSALLASDYYIIPNRIDRYSIIGIDSLQQSITNLFDGDTTHLPCLGIVYTMIPTQPSVKQTQMRERFESKKTVESLENFSSVTHKVDAIQTGKSGTNPMSYKASAADMESILSELLQRLEVKSLE